MRRDIRRLECVSDCLRGGKDSQSRWVKLHSQSPANERDDALFDADTPHATRALLLPPRQNKQCRYNVMTWIAVRDMNGIGKTKDT
jgi:ribonuclease HI